MRFGSMAVLGVGIWLGSLLAGFDGPHLHAGDDRPVAHRHLNVGYHSHDHASSGGPAAPERSEGPDTPEPGDTVVSLGCGGSLLPDPIAPRIEQRAVARPLASLDRSLRLADLQSTLGARAPPA